MFLSILLLFFAILDSLPSLELIDELETVDLLPELDGRIPWADYCTHGSEYSFYVDNSKPYVGAKIEFTTKMKNKPHCISEATVKLIDEVANHYVLRDNVIRCQSCLTRYSDDVVVGMAREGRNNFTVHVCAGPYEDLGACPLVYDVVVTARSLTPAQYLWGGYITPEKGSTAYWLGSPLGNLIGSITCYSLVPVCCILLCCCGACWITLAGEAGLYAIVSCSACCCIGWMCCCLSATIAIIVFAVYYPRGNPVSS